MDDFVIPAKTIKPIPIIKFTKNGIQYSLLLERPLKSNALRHINKYSFIIKKFLFPAKP